MPNRGIADVVFVIDASASMGPCIGALKSSIAAFASSLDGPNAGSFDLRLEFIAMKVDPKAQSYLVNSSRSDNPWQVLYGESGQAAPSELWSTPSQFRQALARIEVGADEDSLMALDFALDLPWRTASGCHRVVVLLTDEPPETGFEPAERRTMTASLVRKMNDLRVKLFMVGPYSETLVELQQADGADYLQIQDADIGRGLATVDFRKVLAAIAKSISVTSTQQAPKSVERALFGQDGWGSGGAFDMHGSR